MLQAGLASRGIADGPLAHPVHPGAAWGVVIPWVSSAFGGRVEAERRQVTVLFADMVGFTSFAERSGEEAAFTLMRSLWRLMADSVREHGGVVQDFTGDGIMAVFGAPIAFEDGPLRAQAV